MQVIDYKAGNLTSVAQDPAPSGRGNIVTGDLSLSRIRRAHRPPRRWPLRGDRAARPDRPNRERSAKRIARGIPFLGICVGMQWLSRAPQRPRDSRTRRYSRRCTRFPEGKKRCHTSAGIPSTSVPARVFWRHRAGEFCLLHAFLQGPRHCGDGSRHALYRAFRRGRRARQRNGRAVPPGKIRRDRPQSAFKFPPGSHKPC